MTHNNNMTLRGFLKCVAMLSVSTPLVIAIAKQPQLPPRKTKFILGDFVEVGPNPYPGKHYMWAHAVGKRGFIMRAHTENISPGTTAIYSVTDRGAWFYDNQLKLIKPCDPAVLDIVKHFVRP